MILIAFGSNLESKAYGSPLNNCKQGIKLIKKNFFVSKVSRLYETEPIPKSNQSWYINGVLEIFSPLKPHDILKKLLFLERLLGRKRKFKNEPRIIDFDLLCYGNIIFNNSKITIPHPRIHKRSFVLKPICDINPNWEHPVLKKKANVLLKKLANQKIFLKKP